MGGFHNDVAYDDVFSWAKEEIVGGGLVMSSDKTVVLSADFLAPFDLLTFEKLQQNNFGPQCF